MSGSSFIRRRRYYVAGCTQERHNKAEACGFLPYVSSHVLCMNILFRCTRKCLSGSAQKSAEASVTVHTAAQGMEHPWRSSALPCGQSPMHALGNPCLPSLPLINHSLPSLPLSNPSLPLLRLGNGSVTRAPLDTTGTTATASPTATRSSSLATRRWRAGATRTSTAVWGANSHDSPRYQRAPVYCGVLTHFLYFCRVSRVCVWIQFRHLAHWTLQWPLDVDVPTVCVRVVAMA